MTRVRRIGSKRRHVLIVAGTAVLVAAGALAAYLALPNLVSEDRLRKALTAHAATWSGGEVRLPEGAVVSSGRGLVITVEDAEFGGRFGGAEWHLDVALITATFKMLPLLKGKVEIETLTLDEPHLRLLDRDDTAMAALRDLPADNANRLGPEGEVIVTDASFLYEGKTGRRVGFGGVDLRMAAEPDSTAVLLNGALAAGAGRLHLEGRLEDPAGAFSDRGSIARLALRGAATADDAGTPPPQPNPDVPGAVQEHQMISEVRRIASTFGFSGTGPLAIEGRISATPRKLRIANATVSFGGALAESDLTIALGGDEPPIDQLGGVVRAAEAAWRDAATAIDAGTWRDAPVALDWLAPLEITLAARLHDSRIAGSNLEARRIRLEASGGRAHLEVDGVGDLGRLQGELALSAVPAGDPLQMAVNGRLEEVDFGGTLRTLLLYAPPPLVSPPQLPEGTINAEVDLATRGETLGAMVAALDGAVSVKARDGSVAGADVALTLEGLADGREIMTEKDGPLIPSAGRTRFNTAEGRIDFMSGIARLSAFRIRGERYSIEMSGEAELSTGAVRADGQAKLHAEATDERDSFLIVDLPFGLGGTLAAPVVAAGVPRSVDDLTSEAAAEGDIE
ncbi:MAG: AsmA-like C-terminal region-containing protein [Roseovarius sp.]